MSEYIKQYGGVLIAVIVAITLMSLLNQEKSIGVDTYGQMIANSPQNQNYKDIDDIVEGIIPDIKVHKYLIVEVSADASIKDAIISAYGSTDPDTYDINIIENGGKMCTADIKKRIQAGKVNVVYREEKFDPNKIGTYIVEYYVKNTSNDGIWTSKQAHIIVEDYIKTE